MKIADGLAFAEQESADGSELVLASPRSEKGLIRFRVDASGIWLTVCDRRWRLSGDEGVVVRPFPIFRPVDLFFRDSVVHLRPDLSDVECDQAIELSLEPVPEGPQPLLSHTRIRQLQNQLNESRLGLAVVNPEAAKPEVAEPEKPRRAPTPLIAPPRAPGYRKIAGKGRPSAVRLAPDPVPRDEIPLLTETVTPKVPAPVAISAVAGIPERAAEVVDVAAEIVVSEPKQRPRRAVTAPRRRIFARLVAFAVGVLMVSIDLPSVPIPGGAVEEAVPAPPPPSEAVGTGSAAARDGSGEADSSRQLKAAVQALLESKSPPDPVTRQFVEDALRAVNDSDATHDASRGLILPDVPGESARLPETAE